jgi:hypothetical protein
VRYGLAPEEFLAARGPSLGPARPNSSASRKSSANLSGPISTTGPNGWTSAPDPRPAHQAGLCQDRIYGLDLCTHDLPEFFSYRRDKSTGRQASLIWIKES